MGILRRILGNPNGREPVVRFEAFIRASSRVNEATVKLYAREGRRFAGWLGSRALTLEAVQEYEAWLKTKYRPNSLTNKVSGLNLYLKWRDTDFRIRRPPKEINPHPRIIEDAQYRELLGRMKDPMDRLAVRLTHDTFWSPIDIVQIRKEDVAFGDPTIIRKVRQKTHAAYVVAEAILEKETASELREYLEANPTLDYIFPGDRRKGRPFRNRTWPNKVLDRYGVDFSPRWFRSSGATSWPGDDIKGLMTQGGWREPRTILLHYRGNVVERQVKSFEAAMGHAAKDRENDPELPGYG